MIYPNFSFEKRLWKKGFKYIAGVDEVGRGCLAGPVVAGAVVLAPITNYQLPIINEQQKIKIDDSKRLTPRQRDVADKWIRSNALAYGIGTGSVAEIDKLGIVKATARAFRRAIREARKKILRYEDTKILGGRKRGKSSEHLISQYPDIFLLIDAFYIPYVRGIRMPCKRHRKKRFISDTCNQLAIIHGDEKSYSIAAASIIAKVYRDKLMVDLGNNFKYKKYGWEQNKGYGTAEHQGAINKWGVTRHHRKIFIHN